MYGVATPYTEIDDLVLAQPRQLSFESNKVTLCECAEIEQWKMSFVQVKETLPLFQKPIFSGCFVFNEQATCGHAITLLLRPSRAIRLSLRGFSRAR
jgi:hypothetical protein